MKYLLIIVACLLLSVGVFAEDFSYGTSDSTDGAFTSHIDLDGGWGRGSVVSVTTGGTLDTIRTVLDDDCTDCVARVAMFRDSDDVLMDSTNHVAFDFSGGNGEVLLTFQNDVAGGGDLADGVDYFFLINVITTTGSGHTLRIGLTLDGTRRSGDVDEDAWDNPAVNVTDVSATLYTLGKVWWHSAAEETAGQVMMIGSD